jgi:hypothetical protein
MIAAKTRVRADPEVNAVNFNVAAGPGTISAHAGAAGRQSHGQEQA